MRKEVNICIFKLIIEARKQGKLPVVQRGGGGERGAYCGNGRRLLVRLRQSGGNLKSGENKHSALEKLQHENIASTHI